MYTKDRTFLEAINGQSRRIYTRMMVGEALVPCLSIDFSDIRERLIGSFSAKSITVTYDINDYSESLLDQEISLYVTVSGSPLEVLVGKFYVDAEDITYDELKSTVTFTAYDKAFEFNKQIGSMVFPITETQLLDHIGDTMGVTIDRSHVDVYKPFTVLSLPKLKSFGDNVVTQSADGNIKATGTDYDRAYTIIDLPTDGMYEITLEMINNNAKSMESMIVYDANGMDLNTILMETTQPTVSRFYVSNQSRVEFLIQTHYDPIGISNLNVTISKFEIREVVNDTNEISFNVINIAEGDEYTYRDLVMDYATYRGLSAHINREGVLVFRDPFKTTVDTTIDGEAYTDLKLDKNETIIDSISYEHEGITDPVWYNVSGVAGEFKNQITIKDNPLMSLLGRERLEEVVKNIFDSMVKKDPSVGLSYHIFETNQFIGPHYDPMDVVVIRDKNDNEYNSIIHSITWTWNGGLKGTLSGNFAEEARSDQKLSGTARDIKSMGVKVDRVDGRITAFVQEVETIEQKTNELSSLIELTSQDLLVEIVNREQMGDNILAQMRSAIELEVDNMNISFSELMDKLENGEVTLAEVSAYFNFSANGLEIGKSDSPFKINIDNEEIGFLQNGQKVAYITGSTLYIQQSTILNSITMANHIIEKSPFTNGRTLFRRI